MDGAGTIDRREGRREKIEREASTVPARTLEIASG
jgi:hypothetical protein